MFAFGIWLAVVCMPTGDGVPVVRGHGYLEDFKIESNLLKIPEIARHAVAVRHELLADRIPQARAAFDELVKSAEPTLAPMQLLSLRYRAAKFAWVDFDIDSARSQCEALIEALPSDPNGFLLGMARSLRLQIALLDGNADLALRTHRETRGNGMCGKALDEFERTHNLLTAYREAMASPKPLGTLLGLIGRCARDSENQIGPLIAFATISQCEQNRNVWLARALLESVIEWQPSDWATAYAKYRLAQLKAD